VRKDLYNNNTFDFVALHKIINSLVKSIGRNTLWMHKHEHTLEQIFAEFDDEEDNENDIYSNNQSFRNE